MSKVTVGSAKPAKKPNLFGQTQSTYELSNKVSITVPSIYNVFTVLGAGAYGTVVAAKDPDDEIVAIKKFSNPFGHLIYAKRTLRELRFLRVLRHENVIGIKSVHLSGPSHSDLGDIYVVTEVMDTDLSYLLRSEQHLSTSHIKFFLYQILRGVKYMHSAGIIHRDLKPKNLLVSKNCDLKICDFGLARLHNDFVTDGANHNTPMTEYVCTRWYRAPEVLCCWSNYSYPVDLWSIGCIFAEMIVRRTIFKGNSTLDQLEKIGLTMGSPSTEEINAIPNEKARDYLKRQRRIPKKPVQSWMVGTFGAPNADGKDGPMTQSYDIISSLLEFDPSKRMTVKECLDHPYLDELHDPDDEPESKGAHRENHDFEYERRKVDENGLKEELFLEVLEYEPGASCKSQFKIDYDITKYRLLKPGEYQYYDDDDEEDESEHNHSLGVDVKIS